MISGSSSTLHAGSPGAERGTASDGSGVFLAVFLLLPQEIAVSHNLSTVDAQFPLFSAFRPGDFGAEYSPS
jgi:hypothetical protein